MRSAIRRRGLGALVVSGWLGLSGCSQWDAEAQARDRAREVLACEAVRVEARSQYTFAARGCERAIGIACTSAANEPVCIPVRLSGLEQALGPTSGGESPDAAETEGESVAVDDESGAGRSPEVASDAISPAMTVGEPTADENPERGNSGGARVTEVDVGRASAGAENVAVETAESVVVRAYLDSRAPDVLTCTNTIRLALHAAWDGRGVVRFALTGPLAGSIEEGCVRQTLGGFTTGAGDPGELLHLVQSPGP